MSISSKDFLQKIRDLLSMCEVLERKHCVVLLLAVYKRCSASSLHEFHISRLCWQYSPPETDIYRLPFRKQFGPTALGLALLKIHTVVL